MPVRVNVRVVLFLTIIGFILTACDQQQMQKISTAVSAQSSAAPTFGAIVAGPTTAATTSTSVSATRTVTATRTVAPTRTPKITVTRTPTKVVTKKPTVPTPTPGPTHTPSNTPDVTPTITGTPLPTLNKDVMGIQAYGNVGDNDWAQFMDRAQFMGFAWIKFQLSWKELEPSKGQYTQQLDVIKKNIFDSGKRNFVTLISIAKAPDWARSANARGQNDGPPANSQDLIDFLSNLLQDKNIAQGNFIRAVEIWNEPNLITEWTGSPFNGGAYVQLFTPVYKALRALNPGLMILTSGLATTGDSNGSVDDRKWLQQMYGAGLPVGDPNFAIAAHPYGYANPPDARCCTSPSKGWDDHPSFFFLDTINDYHNIMVQNKDTQTKLWATEFGWPSFDGLKEGPHDTGQPAMPPNDPGLAWMTRLTEDQQAQYIIRAYQLAQMSDIASFMGPMFLWNLNFASLPGFTTAKTPSRPEAGFSVLNADTFPRQAFYLLSGSAKKQ